MKTFSGKTKLKEQDEDITSLIRRKKKQSVPNLNHNNKLKKKKVINDNIKNEQKKSKNVNTKWTLQFNYHKFSTKQKQVSLSFGELMEFEKKNCNRQLEIECL